MIQTSFLGSSLRGGGRGDKDQYDKCQMLFISVFLSFVISTSYNIISIFSSSREDIDLAAAGWSKFSHNIATLSAAAAAAANATAAAAAVTIPEIKY